MSDETQAVFQTSLYCLCSALGRLWKPSYRDEDTA